MLFSTNETEWKGVEIVPILMSSGLAVKLTVDPFETKISVSSASKGSKKKVKRKEKSVSNLDMPRRSEAHILEAFWWGKQDQKSGPTSKRKEGWRSDRYLSSK